MAKDPAFLFYPGDYLRDTQVLSESVQVAYDRIMCEHMRNICISEKQLKFFTKRLSEDERDELLMVLTEVRGGYEIEWVAESVRKRKAYSESRRKNRVKKEELNPKKTSESYDNHMENENESKDDSINKSKDGDILIPEILDSFPFDHFWNIYNKKNDKKYCETKWNKLPEKDREEIMRVVYDYINATPEIQYRKNPKTFLNQRSWEDEGLCLTKNTLQDGEQSTEAIIAKRNYAN